MNEYDILPENVEQHLRAVRATVPVIEPTRADMARQAFLQEVRSLRSQQPLSRQATSRFASLAMLLPRRKDGTRMIRLARAAVALALVVGSTFGSIYAVDASGPGQTFYPLDLGLEQIQHQLAATIQWQAQLEYRLAVERAAEVRHQARQGQPSDAAALLQLRVQLQRALESASNLEEPAMVRMLTQLRTMTQEQERLFNEAGLQEAAQIMQRARLQVQVGIDDPVAFRAQVRAGQGWEEPNGDTNRTNQAVDRGESAPAGQVPDRAQQEQNQLRSEDGEGPKYEQGPAPMQERNQLQQGTQTGNAGEPANSLETSVTAGDQDKNQDQDQQQDQLQDRSGDCDGEPDQDQDRQQDQQQDQSGNPPGEPGGPGGPPASGEDADLSSQDDQDQDQDQDQQQDQQQNQSGDCDGDPDQDQDQDQTQNQDQDQTGAGNGKGSP